MAIIVRTAAFSLALLLASQGISTSQLDSAPDSALQSHIKYVFVIYQENHSFDNYFGTYPHAENLGTALAHAHGFRQYDSIGKQWVTPFRITDPDISGPSQSRDVAIAKIHDGAMDNFVSEQERVSLAKNLDPADAQAAGLVTMAHYDCDTLPFLWKYARYFTLFDRFFQAMTAPSTPGNVEILAAQAGQTQWAHHPDQSSANPEGLGDPLVNDLDPAYGPYPPSSKAKAVQIPQRYATLPLTFAGTDNAKATHETSDVAEDLAAIARSGRTPLPWGWYQEGYVSPHEALPGYVAHHNAPQYFAYLRNNDVYWSHIHPLPQILAQLHNGTLPDRGVFYIKGGSRNGFGWKPANPDPMVQAEYRGDDDHPGPGDADHQVGEAFVATFVNAIARSKYWNDSAIVITWDDAGGFYDHVPPPHFERCADGNPCGDGQRLPLLLISPYAKNGAVIHDTGDTGSIVKFIETVFDLPALASLPDEKPYLPEGPRDADPALTNLAGAFDIARLNGSTAPLPAALAEIPDMIVGAFPPPMSCSSLGITPIVPGETSNAPPPGFQPRAEHGK